MALVPWAKSVIVDNLDVFGTRVGPAETNPVLIVDSDRMLPDPISAEFLQSQAG